MNSVSVCHSVRNISVYIRPNPCQTFQQNICRSHTVYIIISDDPDFYLLLYFFLQNIYSFFHIFHQPGRWKFIYCSKKIFSYFLISYYISVSDQPGNHRVDMKLLTDLIKVCFLCSHYPFFHVYSPRIISWYIFRKSSRYSRSASLLA